MALTITTVAVGNGPRWNAAGGVHVPNGTNYGLNLRVEDALDFVNNGPLFKALSLFIKAADDESRAVGIAAAQERKAQFAKGKKVA